MAALFVYHRVTQPDDSQVLMRISRSGDLVVDDHDLHKMLTGDRVIPPTLALAAYCVNGWYWATDITVDLDVVVSSSERLVRAAEIIAEEDFPVDLVRSVEGRRLSTGGGSLGVSELSSEVLRRFGDEQMERYSAAVAEPPSAGSFDRFLVFAASSTIREQYIYFIDLDRRDRAAIRRFDSQPFPIEAGSDKAWIAGSSSPVEVRREDCGRVAQSGWTP